jgi:glutathione S-transferase
MPAYRLHCFCQSGNAYKVALYLNCAGLDWEPVFVDFMKGETRDPQWRERVNEMGEAPVLEVVGGKKLSQSGAILSWLAEKTGQFAPQGEDERYEALRWMLFDNHKFTSYLATFRFLRAFAPQAPDPAVLSFLKPRIDGALGIVDKRLAKSPFIVGTRPTIADLSLAGYMFYPADETGYDFKVSHPGIQAWTERIKALPGWKGPYDLMPGERIKPLR